MFKEIANNAALVLGLFIALAAVYKLVDAFMKSRYDAKLLLGRIEKELFPNHGSSLRDAVDRLEVAMTSMMKEHLETRTRVDDLYLMMTEYHVGRNRVVPEQCQEDGSDQ